MAVTARRKLVHRRREEARVERVAAVDGHRWSNSTVCSVVPASSSKRVAHHRKPFLSITMSLPSGKVDNNQSKEAKGWLRW